MLLQIISNVNITNDKFPTITPKTDILAIVGYNEKMDFKYLRAFIKFNSNKFKKIILVPPTNYIGKNIKADVLLNNKMEIGDYVIYGTPYKSPKDQQYITEQIAQSKGKKIIILTHNLPPLESINESVFMLAYAKSENYTQNYPIDFFNKTEIVNNDYEQKKFDFVWSSIFSE